MRSGSGQVASSSYDDSNIKYKERDTSLIEQISIQQFSLYINTEQQENHHNKKLLQVKIMSDSTLPNPSFNFAVTVGIKKEKSLQEHNSLNSIYVKS